MKKIALFLATILLTFSLYSCNSTPVKEPKLFYFKTTVFCIPQGTIEELEEYIFLNKYDYTQLNKQPNETYVLQENKLYLLLVYCSQGNRGVGATRFIYDEEIIQVTPTNVNVGEYYFIKGAKPSTGVSFCIEEVAPPYDCTPTTYYFDFV